MAELYSCMYMGAAFGAEHCDDTLRRYHRRWEVRPHVDFESASLSGAYGSRNQPDIVYRYGPALFHRGLLQEIGPAAFYGALDVLLREQGGRYVTTEHLQHYLEGASGRDLGDWFDFHVHGGYLPAVVARWDAKGATVVGEIEADIPFGTFTVPVRIRSKDGDVDLMVEVVDGKGSFTGVAPSRKGLDVEVDPDQRRLLRRRGSRHAF